MSETSRHVLKGIALLFVYGFLVLLGLGIEHLEQLARDL
jgi:hypothetical protein